MSASAARTRPAAPRRDGAAQRAARARARRTGRRPSAPTTARSRVASGPKPRVRGRVERDRRRARRRPPRRGDGRHPAGQARAARGAPALPGRHRPRRDGRRGASPGVALRRRAAALGGEAARPRSRCAPSLIALRGGELAAYHGVEHKAIGAYEQDADDAARRDQGARPLRLAPDGPAAGRQPRRHRAAAPRRRAPVAAGGRRRPARLDRRRRRGLRVVRAPRRHRAGARPAPPGHELQRVLGTREPTEEQLEVGRAALAEILRAEGRADARLDPPMPYPA